MKSSSSKPPDTSIVLSGLKEMLCTELMCPFRVSTFLPVCTSQILIDLSLLAVTIIGSYALLFYDCDGELLHLRTLIPSEWPSRCMTGSFYLGLHNKAFESFEQVARILPAESHLTEFIPSLWLIHFRRHSFG
jgi:hypothetical protein